MALSTPTRQRPIRYSVVSAIYNAEKYLDDYFESIIGQTLDFERHIELTMARRTNRPPSLNAGERGTQIT